MVQTSVDTCKNVNLDPEMCLRRGELCTGNLAECISCDEWFNEQNNVRFYIGKKIHTTKDKQSKPTQNKKPKYFEPRREKPNLRGLRPEWYQSSLRTYSD